MTKSEISTLDWQGVCRAASALGIEPDTLPPPNAPAVASRDRSNDESGTDVTHEEWAAMAEVLPADCGSERRSTISAALWIVATGKPWTLLPLRLGGWNAQRRRFARWSHAGHWARLAEAVDAAPNVAADRKQLYDRIAQKAARQKALLPEFRARVTGYRS